jgi:phage tail-like protein
MSILTKLPGVYLDLIEVGTDTGIIVANTTPEASTPFPAPVDTDIEFDIFALDSSGYDDLQTKVWVNDTLAYDGAAGGFMVGFGGSVASDSGDAHFTINPDSNFGSSETVEVRVVSQLIGGGASVDYTYTFKTVDTVRPKVVNAEARDAQTVRVFFDSGMTDDDATATGDALNPGNYAVVFVGANDRDAGVYGTPTAITRVSGGRYDVAVDVVLTFGKPYRVEVVNAEDEAGNVIDYSANTYDFTSWSPPDWPDLRSFSLWKMLSPDDRKSDESSGDLERFISMLQDIVDVLLWSTDRMSTIWDIYECDSQYLDPLLADAGNPFDFDFTDTEKRKLLARIDELYGQKGTARGIINALRFLIGLDPVIISEYNTEAWLLGEGLLGVDTYLGPGELANLFTFIVQVDEALDADTEERVNRVIEYMKTHHTHYKVVEPSDPEYVNHWSLGVSLLGVETYLH